MSVSTTNHQAEPKSAATLPSPNQSRSPLLKLQIPISQNPTIVKLEMTAKSTTVKKPIREKPTKVNNTDRAPKIWFGKVYEPDCLGKGSMVRIVWEGYFEADWEGFYDADRLGE